MQTVRKANHARSTTLARVERGHMTDYTGAIAISNSNAFIGQNNPRFIVLHGTAGGTSAQAIANYFASTQGTSEPVSATYVVGQDGTVVQCNAESDGAWGEGYISGTSGVSGNGFGNMHHDTWWDSGINPNL